MDYKITPPTSAIDTEVALPASKSISNRMLMLRALCRGSLPELHNVAECDDTSAMEAALGTNEEYVNIGAAGTAMRFMTAYFATCEGRTTVLDGSERMRRRPIKILVDALRSCGARISYAGEDGYPPLRIEGCRMHARSVSISGSVSSQYISAILMIAPVIGCSRVELTGDVVSMPYIKMTLSMMRGMGVDCTLEDNVVKIAPNSSYKPVEMTVESDWSAASYWYELAALFPSSRITLQGLEQDSVQGDSAVARLMSEFGVKTDYRPGKVTISSASASRGVVEMDLGENPDLAQTIVVTACLAGRHFVISGLKTLKIKETDRIEALRAELRKLGYVLSVSGDVSLEWHGERCDPTPNPHIATYADHRMAMAFAPAAILFPGIVVEDAEVVSKSYPHFWDHLAGSGFKIERV